MVSCLCVVLCCVVLYCCEMWNYCTFLKHAACTWSAQNVWTNQRSEKWQFATLAQRSQRLSKDVGHLNFENNFCSRNMGQINVVKSRQSCKLQKLGSRLVRPWILFPYKSLKSEIAITLKLLLPWLSNFRNLLILVYSFTWYKLFILFMFVYDKIYDTIRVLILFVDSP